MIQAAAAQPPSALSPLKHRTFAILWVATIASSIGTWMNDVGAAWLMTELSPSPATVALVQAATTLPVFLLALPAGALADIVDRRKLLLVVNLLMAGVAAAMTAVVLLGAMTAPLLLLFTFLLGAGAAFVAPAWQAIVPSLIPRPELPAAISLNSVGINVSRAIGPAFAGVLIVALGLWSPFLVNALSFIGILLALWLWKGETKDPAALPAEAIVPAMIAGVRYAVRSAPLKRTIGRAVSFFAFASAYWAMLPLVARDVLGGGSSLYGILMACVGAGAVMGAALLPKVRAYLDMNRLVMAGSLLTALAMAVLSTLRSELAAAIAMIVAGAGWIAVLSSFQVSAQTALPNWVRARGLSIFLTAFFGAMAAGAALWGFVAENLGVPTTLLLAAGGLAAVALGTLGIRLEKSDGSELEASLHWPAPPSVPADAADAGPTMVTLDYTVAPENEERFLDLIARLRTSRLRDGAYGWHVFRVVENGSLFREVFYAASWLDHLRQHDRVNKGDEELQSRIKDLTVSGAGPTVLHHLPPRFAGAGHGPDPNHAF